MEIVDKRKRTDEVCEDNLKSLKAGDLINFGQDTGDMDNIGLVVAKGNKYMIIDCLQSNLSYWYGYDVLMNPVPKEKLINILRSNFYFAHVINANLVINDD